MHKSQKGFAPIIIILVVLIVLVVGGAGIVAYKKMQIKNNASEVSQIQQVPAVAQTSEQKLATPSLSDWKTYRNEEFMFSYPKQYTFTKTKFGDCFYTTLNGDGPYFCTEIHTNDEKLSLFEWWKKQDKSNDLVQDTNIIVSGRIALVFNSQPDTFPSASIIFKRNEDIIELSGSGIPDEVLSTFRFFESHQ